MSVKRGASARTLKSNLKRVDAHVIRPHEYKELPEVTDEMLARGAVERAGRPVSGNPRLLEDEEKLREIRHRELKAAIQEGIDSEDAGSVEEVVARNRARRRKRSASNK